MKELLKDLELSDEQLGKIEEAHKVKVADVIKDKFVPKERFDEINETAKQRQTEIDKRDKQLEDLSKSEKGIEELTQKLKDLETANAKAKEDFEEQLKETKLNNALKLAVNGKVKDIDLVLGLLDKSKIELDENCNIKMGFQEQFDELKTSKDFLFVQENDGKPEIKGSKPADGQTPPPKTTLKEELNSLLAKDTLTGAEQKRLNELPALLKEESTK